MAGSASGPRSPRDYHDAVLGDVVLGPRREIHLRIHVAFGGVVSIRFGAVDNLDEARIFFGYLRGPPFDHGRLDRIDSLRAVADGWRLELDHAGVFTIRTRKPPTVVPQ